MSQQHMEQQMEQQDLSREQQMEQDEQEFAQALDDAFADSHDESEAQTGQQQEEQESPQGEPEASQEDLTEQTPSVPPAVSDVTPQPAPQTAPQPQPQPEAPRRIEAVPEEIANEFENLRQRNPQAAELAMEDSPEGKAIRDRLLDGGIYAAEDRADFILSRRNAAVEAAAREEAAQHQRVIEQHNAWFRDVLRQEVPDYFAMCNDPQRAAEAVQYRNDIVAWIKTKTFAEGEALMAIAQRGRDPREVVNLIKTFEREKAAARQGKNLPDPTAALAVPGRGAPVAPVGIGDKDDFDAGLDAALSSYR